MMKIYFLSLGLVLGVLLCPVLAQDFAQQERLLEDSFWDLQASNGNFVNAAAAHFRLQRDYEVQKIRAAIFELHEAARNSNLEFSQQYAAKLQWAKVESAKENILNILNQISSLETSPSPGFDYAKTWNGIITKRNSSFRKYIREMIQYLKLAHWGEDPHYGRAFSIIRENFEHLLWLNQTLPHSPELLRFLWNFFAVKPDIHAPHFSPQMHSFLDSFGRRRNFPIHTNGFTDEARENFQQPGLHLWVMNHRDIYMDPYFVSQILKAASCEWDCHYAVDPFRYFGGNTPLISNRMTEMSDFLPVGSQPGEAVKRAKEIIRARKRANIFIFPEATTSLIGDTATLDPYFALVFIRSLKRADIPGGIHLHIVSTDTPVSPRVNFRQRISQYFKMPSRSVGLYYHGSFSDSELPRRLNEDAGFVLNSKIWTEFVSVQPSDDQTIHGQLRAEALTASLKKMLRADCQSLLGSGHLGAR